MLKRFVIERDMPGIGSKAREDFRAAAAKSNAVLAQLAPAIQWVHSYVSPDRITCIYLAQDKAIIRRHAEMAGFPTNRILEVTRVIDPTTAQP